MHTLARKSSSGNIAAYLVASFFSVLALSIQVRFLSKHFSPHLTEAPGATLRNCAVFGSLSAEEDRYWVGLCSLRSFSGGESLVEFEERTSDIFVIVSGEIRSLLRYAVGKEAILGSFRRGDLLGEISAIDGLPRSASLTAVTDAAVLVMPRNVLGELLRQRHEVCLALLRLMAARIRVMNERVSELTFLDTKHRLYNALLRLSRPRQDGGRERIVSPPLVHADLAEMIGASRETVSREMSKLSRDGLLERTSRAIVLKNPSELSRRISQALDQ